MPVTAGEALLLPPAALALPVRVSVALVAPEMAGEALEAGEALACPVASAEVEAEGVVLKEAKGLLAVPLPSAAVADTVGESHEGVALALGEGVVEGVTLPGL